MRKTNDIIERLFNEGPSIGPPPTPPRPYRTTGHKDGQLPPPLPPRVSPGRPSQVNPQEKPVVEGSSQWISALGIIRDMFPSVDVVVCEMVLQANNGFRFWQLNSCAEIAA